MNRYAIAIDLGGTNTRVALIDHNYSILKREQFPTNAENPAVTLENIRRTVESFGETAEGCAMSAPGPMNLREGTLLTPPNLHGDWHYFHLTAELEKCLHMPVILENDANLAALAEASLGEGRDCHVVQFLTISTGVGAGLCIDGKIFHGAHGYANEVENIIVDPAGRSQGALIPGGIESLSSGTAITAQALEAGLEVKHAGEVYDLARLGNQEAQRITEYSRDMLADFIAGIYGYTDPDIVILGGSVAMKTPGFAEDMEERVRKKVYPYVADIVKIRRSTLSEDSGLLGAACLVFQSSGEQL